MALMDGYQLATQMVACDDLKTALKRYDKQAMPRSAKSIKMSRVAVFVFTSTGIFNYALMSVAKLAGWWFGVQPKHGQELQGRAAQGQ